MPIGLETEDDPEAMPPLSERFLSMLGHELRNPLATINMSLWMLRRAGLHGKAAEAIDTIRHSVTRMSGLIDNMLDLAQGHLHHGMTLERDADEPLRPVLQAVIAECQETWPTRSIEAEIDLQSPVTCNRGRIAQLLSILLRNALLHGAADQPIRVRAVSDETQFELSVCNRGEPLAAQILDRLHHQFSCGDDVPGPHGMGLGLFVAAAIARAHGGELSVKIEDGDICFCFHMGVN